MRISVIGTGYVGLVLGTCLADAGNDVIGIDVDDEKVEKLNDGVSPIFEPGLEELLQTNLSQKRLSFSSNFKYGVGEAEIVFVTVGTPTGKDGSTDLSVFLEVIEQLKLLLRPEQIIVIKSTVPVGTAEEVLERLDRKNAVVSNPEFLREGSALEDFQKPERVVLGGSDSVALQKLKELYAPFVRSGNPLIVTSHRSAELSKYVCNAYLATRISFINEMANLAEELSADISEVRQVLVTDSRIGQKFLYPGMGYGGSCFPKDVQSLLYQSKKVNYPLTILEATHTVNSDQSVRFFRKIARYYKTLNGKRLALWGLSFKPRTDDVREAPALKVIRLLLEKEAQVSVYDPVATPIVRRIFENKIHYGEDQYEILRGADGLVIATEWPQFRTPDFSRMKNMLKKHAIFDGRNLYEAEKMKQLGFHYEGVGLS